MQDFDLHFDVHSQSHLPLNVGCSIRLIVLVRNSLPVKWLLVNTSVNVLYLL